MSNATADRLTPLVDACFAARCDYWLALRAIVRGELPGAKRGRRWFVDTVDLARFLAARDAAEAAP